MSAGPRERMIRIMAGAGPAAIMPRCQKLNNEWVDKHRSLRTCDV